MACILLCLSGIQLTVCAEPDENAAADTVPIAEAASRMEYSDTDDGIILTCYRWSSEDAVVIPEQIDGKTVIGIGASAFRYCYAYTIELPPTIRKIGESAFENCVYLQAVAIPQNCTEIADAAFRGCRQLSYVDLPQSVQRIGAAAFEGTPYLENLTEDMVILGDGILYAYTGQETQLSIPEKVRIIGQNAFAGHEELTSVTISEGVQRIQDGAFADCTALKNIDLQADLSELAPNAFQGTKWESEAKDSFVVLKDILVKYQGDEQEVVIPDGVRVVNGAAFADCENLTTVTLPISVEEIRKEAFAHCPSLQIVLMGENTKTIGEKAFMDCGMLNYLRLGHSLEIIEAGAFLGCPYLDTVYLPDTLHTIGEKAFGYRYNAKGDVYSKINNSLMLYANTACAMQYATDEELQLKPLPAAENTKPAPEVVKEEDTDNQEDELQHIGWIAGCGIGGILLIAAWIQRMAQKRKER
ncbi:MAG: leucine-rich repeat domain-containing protein [Oscillospiraceae bacterium]|nr:leucine-rich repeat domain-containing protein [Oscillospiraceae bacterium]